MVEPMQDFLYKKCFIAINRSNEKQHRNTLCQFYNYRIKIQGILI